MSSSASLAPVTECPLPLASTLSPGPTNSSVSLHSRSSLSASRPPEPFRPLDDLSPQPLALSCSPSLPPDSGAHSPPPTASSASPPPASTLTLPQCDSVALTLGPTQQNSCPHTPQTAPTPAISGLGLSNCPISALSWWQVAAKASCLSASSQWESQQERLSHHPPEASFQEDPTDRQAEAGGLSSQLQVWGHLPSSLPNLPPSPPQMRGCGVSCPPAQNKPHSLIPVEIQHPERPLLQKQVESGWDLSSVVNRSQEVFSIFTSNLSKNSILPENFPISPEPRKQLEPHLQNSHMQHRETLSVHGPWLPVNHSYAKTDTHMATKTLGILNGWEPCMNASHGAFFLDTDIQKVLEAHVTKFWVKHGWGLPLKVLKPMSLIKLKRAQASPILGMIMVHKII
ncbi:PREDICTED: LOW QUALITY PROTEIN: spermatogenesis-associated protein 31A6-like [Myotis davidii]|uniref:LOW QUALITY PROTEIN: spermatogenesis-associated protein 31A6-like n=1 Tax=Myotis davidii TaxID=225400 RepID=UPI0007676E17|nr:PREDICTED: LOW QUALITY PROTEIN: spermatogenesis-associated protein 31A6-like [Myotis davidii]